jgi:hypothetical protein
LHEKGLTVFGQESACGGSPLTTRVSTAKPSWLQTAKVFSLFAKKKNLFSRQHGQ